MRLSLPLLLLTLLLCTCDFDSYRSQKTVGPLPALGTAVIPVRYAEFNDLAPLFHQDSDTTYLINFWATWCQPCREEIRLLEELAKEEHAKPMEIVLVSLDQKEAAIESIPAFLEANGPNLRSVILTDTSDAVWGPTIDRVWSGSLPTTIIYRGELRYVYRRAFNTFADLDRAVEPLMK
ncbi:TlpA family protein disulfide reductase [Neolewinella antarctica]|uniref:Thiol-disulfide isomerase/thioredoxin n=1 Tax=Neolewinella antarctica TaxID=442734 RepID=A0ABX0XC10_9BACT|nr:TlpA disulfide reductase family protein [Neolewinella antarctica]NJC26312.1 thiol-disulfide isomerase/thioredoxin [Neolewinella antarctica]